MKRSAMSVLFAMVAGMSLAGASYGQTVKLYVVAGQSNATGYGWAPNLQPAGVDAPQADVMFSYNVSAIPGYPWRLSNGWTTLRPGTGAYLATDNANTEKLDQYGPEMTFGRALANLNPDSQVAVIKVAQGATGLDADWRIDGGSNHTNLYQKLRDYVNSQADMLRAQGKTVRIEGLLWSQGEADATSDATANVFQANLGNLISQLRTDLNAPEMQLLVPRLSSSQKDSRLVDASGNMTPAMQTVRQAVQNLAAADNRVKWIDCDGMQVRPDKIHYGDVAQMNLGEKLAYAASGRNMPAFAVNPVHATWEFTKGSPADTKQRVYPASANDLINAASPALASITATELTPLRTTVDGVTYTASLGAINDGTIGTHDWPDPATTSEFTTESDGAGWWNLSIGLDTSAAPNGYDITEIRSITGWMANRVNQQYRLYVSQVGQLGWTDVGEFLFLTPNMTDYGSSQLTIEGNNGLPIATRVDALWFEFRDPRPEPGTNSTEPALRELDVFGNASVPEPAAAAVLPLGALLFLSRWRVR